MPVEVEIGYTSSSRKQKCKKCNAEIPAKTRSLKITKRTTGTVKMVSTYYVCTKCDNVSLGLED